MVFSGTHGLYYWVEGHGDTIQELLRACPEIVLGQRALIYGWNDAILGQEAQANVHGWLASGRLLLSPTLTTLDQLSLDRQRDIRAWAFFARSDIASDFTQLPTAAPLPPSARNGSLRDVEYLHDESPPPMWREDVPGWAAFVAEMQRRFWDDVAALKPESFLEDGGTVVFVTQNQRFHEAVISWLRACESADEIAATRLLDTRTLAPDRHILDVAVGPRGDVAVLSAQQPLERYERLEDARGVSHRRIPAPAPHNYRLHRLTGANVSVLDLSAIAEAFDAVQPLSEGRWLLALRSYERDAARNNAYLYDADGRRVAALSIGRGYKQVHATSNDRLWVGYHDEGVYKYSTFGQAGAVCLDLEGHPLLQFLDIAKQNALPSIDDCTAINVGDDDAVWLYYYGDYPLVRLVAGRFDRIWRDFPIKGARGFAVSGDQALFAGGGRYPRHLFLVDLETRAVQKLRPVDQHGKAITFTGAIGRGAHLYLRTKHELFAIDPASWMGS